VPQPSSHSHSSAPPGTDPYAAYTLYQQYSHHAQGAPPPPHQQQQRPPPQQQQQHHQQQQRMPSQPQVLDFRNLAPAAAAAAPPPVVPPPAAAALPDAQRRILEQVLQLSQAQIAALPPAEQEKVRVLKAQFGAR
jgi:hypothetical protein